MTVGKRDDDVSRRQEFSALATRLARERREAPAIVAEICRLRIGRKRFMRLRREWITAPVAAGLGDAAEQELQRSRKRVAKELVAYALRIAKRLDDSYPRVFRSLYVAGAWRTLGVIHRLNGDFASSWFALCAAEKVLRKASKFAGGSPEVTLVQIEAARTLSAWGRGAMLALDLLGLAEANLRGLPDHRQDIDECRRLRIEIQRSGR